MDPLGHDVGSSLKKPRSSLAPAGTRSSGLLLKRCDDLDARLASQKVHVEAVGFGFFFRAKLVY